MRLRRRQTSIIGNQRGSILIVGYFIIVLFLGLGAVFLFMVVNEARLAERQRLSVTAFHIAEAGIERGLLDLRQDFVNDVTAPSWSDGDINGYAIGPDIYESYAIPYSSTTLNGGTYAVDLQNVAGSEDVWLTASGTVGGITQRLRVYVRIIDISPWANAIYAGAGASGTMINGNVDIRGSVHVLGSGLNPGDYAIDLGGTAELVGNNYNGMDSALRAKVPDLPVVEYNGEFVETLNAELRVKKGLVGLSGSSTVGEADVSGNTVKETVNGTYVTDGYGGNMGSLSVHSDNGTSNGYDLGNASIFPSMSDPHPGYATYQDYLRSNALVLTSELSSLTPGSSFTYSDANGSISMDGSGNMTVSGIVYVDGNNDVNLNSAGSNKTINYTGKGSLVVTGNVGINTNLVTAGNDSFPTNILGIMTPNNISVTTAGLDVMGIFYAENAVIVEKQTDMIGTIVANYFDMGTNVPAIYQVPETINHLPPGMIGGSALWYMVVSWQKD